MKRSTVHIFCISIMPLAVPTNPIQSVQFYSTDSHCNALYILYGFTVTIASGKCFKCPSVLGIKISTVSWTACNFGRCCQRNFEHSRFQDVLYRLTNSVVTTPSLSLRDTLTGSGGKCDLCVRCLG